MQNRPQEDSCCTKLDNIDGKKRLYGIRIHGERILECVIGPILIGLPVREVLAYVITNLGWARSGSYGLQELGKRV